MPGLNITSFCFFALSLAATTIQVSVTLHQEYDPNSLITLTCRNLRPGHCCTAPFAVFSSYSAHVVIFQDLDAWNIAAIWRGSVAASLVHHSALENGCTGQVLRSMVGPGNWEWRMWDEPMMTDSLTPATGASYIEMPRRFPIGGTTSTWLSAEGVMGLVWVGLMSPHDLVQAHSRLQGDGNWFANPRVSRLLGYGSGVRPRSRLRRDIRSERKGTVYARSPFRRVDPTIIEVNGSTYTYSGKGDLAYKDAFGKLLNLTALGEMVRNRGR
ncbi:MAG: hypothetical protein LQ345_004608 [Seirophora villosa]|nr:MAG: hypothetical protein LQ345_004608 [Seirophora villosa]